MRRVILKDFPGEVDFEPNDNRVVFSQLATGHGNGRVKPGLVGGVYGDFKTLVELGALEGIDDILTRLESRRFFENFVKLGKLGRQAQYYIPWMQATYIMVAHRRALEHLPPGADLDALTYDQLKTWALNMHTAAGEAKLGFPVGANGLMHRFLQGYLYPSYTGGTIRKFRSPDAETMWRDFKDLWRHV